MGCADEEERNEKPVMWYITKLAATRDKLWKEKVC